MPQRVPRKDMGQRRGAASPSACLPFLRATGRCFQAFKDNKTRGISIHQNCPWPDSAPGPKAGAEPAVSRGDGRSSRPSMLPSLRQHGGIELCGPISMTVLVFPLPSASAMPGSLPLPTAGARGSGWETLRLPKSRSLPLCPWQERPGISPSTAETRGECKKQNLASAAMAKGRRGRTG